MTYPEIVARLQARHEPVVRVCFDDDEMHDKGYRGNNGIVHWRDRRVTERGLYRFLKLFVDGHGIRAEPERTWLNATTAYDLALWLGYGGARGRPSTG